MDDIPDDISEGIEPPEVDEDGNELVDSELKKLHTLGRMSVSTYVLTQQAEAKRQVAEGVREQRLALNQRLSKVREKVAEERKPMRDIGRKQLEAAVERVSEYRVGLAQTGAQMRSEASVLLDRKRTMVQQHLAKGAQNAKKLGVEQRKKTFEARQEALEEKRRKTLEAKQAALARQAEIDAQRAVALEARKLAFAKSRDERKIASGGAIDEARRYFFAQKVEAAQAVRSSVRGWERERRRGERDTLTRARANRAAITQVQKNAVSNRARVADNHAQVAAQIRVQLRDLDNQRQTVVLATAMDKRSNHQEAYDRKFVDQALAMEVDDTTYGQILLRSRKLISSGAPGGMAMNPAVPRLVNAQKAPASTGSPSHVTTGSPSHEHARRPQKSSAAPRAPPTTMEELRLAMAEETKREAQEDALAAKELEAKAAQEAAGRADAAAQEEQEAAANMQAADAEGDGRSRRRSFIAQLKQDDDEEQQRRLAREPAEAPAGSAGAAPAGNRAAAKLDDAIPGAAAVDADKVSLAERATEPAAARPKASPKEADGDSGVAVGASGSAPESAEETVAEAQQVSSPYSKLEIVEA